MLETDINLWAVLGGAAAYFVIGAIWYGALFAKPWMELTGIKMDKQAEKNDTGIMYATTFVLVLILTYVLAHMLVLTGADTVGLGLTLGVWLWLGFIFTTMLINGLYVSRPHKLTAIDAGYHLAGILAAATVLSLWG